MLFWLIVTIVAIILFLYSWWQYKLTPRAVIEMINGVVPANPQDLADAAGVDLETYSLARVAQSEEGMSSDRAKIAVMYATVNHCNKKGVSITAEVTRADPDRSEYEAAQGHYGRQGIHPYCTTIADPKPHTIELAQSVIDGTALDETQGATGWDNPFSQDAAHAINPYNPATGKGTRSSAEIAQRRKAAGLTMVVISGISTRFWA